jgi:signal transduction histidine kinase
MIRRRRLSIRARLAAGSAGVAAVGLAVLGVLILMQVQQAAVTAATQLADSDLRSYAVDLRTDPGERPDLPATGLLVLVVDPDGVAQRDSMPAALARAARTVGSSGDVTVPEGRFRVVERTVSAKRGVWHLWAARDLTASDALLRGVLMTVGIGIPLAVLATALAAWFVATGALRPVERLRAAADRLRAAGATGRLPVHGAGELAELTTTLNALIEDLRSSAARERRVTADAAHELRTPLAVLAAQVELAARRPREADLLDVRASVDRLTRLADALLALSRADSPEAPPPGSAAVGELVTEAMSAVDHGRLLAPDGVLVDLELADRLDETGVAEIDTTAFRRILVNLIGNSLGAGPDSLVAVRLGTDDGMLVLRVTDDGPGVPEEFLPFAFDRFARAIGATGTGSSGAGLGLALVRRLAERSGGSAALENRTARGAIATVRLPLERGRPQR